MENTDTPIHNRHSIRLKGYDYSKAGAYYITINQKDRLCLFGKIIDEQMLLNDAGTMVNKWWGKIHEKFPDIELGEYQIMPNHFHAIVINNGVGANPVGADPRVCPINDTTNPIVGANPVGADPRICPINDTTNPIVGANPVGADPRICPINDTTNPIVGANPRVRPDPTNENTVGANPCVRPVENTGQTHGSAPTTNGIISIEGEHTGSSLRDVMQWFKTMSTNEYIRGVKSLGWKPFYGKLWQRNYWEHIIPDEKSYQNIANYIINNPKNWKEDELYKS